MIEVAVIVVVCLVWWVIGWRRMQLAGAEGSWLPRRLRGAEVAYAESTFRSERLKVVARVDRAYRRDSQLSLVELKTRNIRRAYRSDVIELSAQRVALAEATGEPVSDIAYVLVKLPGQTTGVAIEVRLLDEREVERLVERWKLVRQGSVCAGAAASPALCRKCAYRDPCQREIGGAP